MSGSEREQQEYLRRLRDIRDLTERRTADDVEKEKLTKEAVDRIAEELLGVRAEHGDGIYTQHPVMAGVLRRALREAYNKGAGDCARLFVDVMLKKTPLR